VRLRVSISLFLLLVLMTGCAITGQTPRMLVIYSTRAALEGFCRGEAITPRRYRLGRDLVVFVGVHEPVTTLYLCPSSAYTHGELSSFRPANCRPGMPDRSDPMFKGLPVSAR